jgi:hypothetical protein
VSLKRGHSRRGHRPEREGSAEAHAAHGDDRRDGDLLLHVRLLPAVRALDPEERPDVGPVLRAAEMQRRPRGLPDAHTRLRRACTRGRGTTSSRGSAALRLGPCRRTPSTRQSSGRSASRSELLVGTTATGFEPASEVTQSASSSGEMHTDSWTTLRQATPSTRTAESTS